MRQESACQNLSGRKAAACSSRFSHQPAYPWKTFRVILPLVNIFWKRSAQILFRTCSLFSPISRFCKGCVNFAINFSSMWIRVISSKVLFKSIVYIYIYIIYIYIYIYINVTTENEFLLSCYTIVFYIIRGFKSLLTYYRIEMTSNNFIPICCRYIIILSVGNTFISARLNQEMFFSTLTIWEAATLKIWK